MAARILNALGGLLMHHRAVACAILLVCAGLAPPEEMAVRIKNDPSLVAPGFGAERVLLGEQASSLQRDRGAPDRIAAPGSVRLLFGDIFGYEEGPSVRFDRIFHYTYGRFTVFLLGGEVVAVAGYDSARVTTDAVNISSGVESFIFNYGNAGLERLARRTSTMYLYRNLGIAVADDGNDDSIDLVLVFPALTPWELAPRPR